MSNSIQYFYQQGLSFFEQGKYLEAIEQLEQAMKLDPKDVNTVFLLANTSRYMEMYEVSIKWYDYAISLSPEAVEIYYNKTHSLVALNRLEEALEIMKILEQFMFEDAIFWNHFGTIQLRQSELLGAAKSFKRALECNAKYGTAWSNLAYCSYHLSRKEWEIYYAEAEKYLKDDPHFYIDRATCRFMSGKYEQAWDDYRHRLHPAIKNSVTYDHSLPYWEGQDLSGKTILISAEQGVGDQIVFLSVLKDLSKRAGRVILEIHPKLLNLYKENFPKIEVRTPVPETHDLKVHYTYHWLEEKVDYFAPMGSAFFYCRQTLESFPAQIDYLKPHKKRALYWQKKLSSLNDKPKVGISWNSTSQLNGRSDSYMEFQQLVSVLNDMSDFQFINIQYGTSSKDLEQCGVNVDGTPLIYHFDEIDLFNDIDDTAALVSNLDFVISVRNTQLCLAGALGVKTLGVKGSLFQFGYRNIDPVFPSLIYTHSQGDDVKMMKQFTAILSEFVERLEKFWTIRNDPAFFMLESWKDLNKK